MLRRYKEKKARRKVKLPQTTITCYTSYKKVDGTFNHQTKKIDKDSFKNEVWNFIDSMEDNVREAFKERGNCSSTVSFNIHVTREV